MAKKLKRKEIEKLKFLQTQWEYSVGFSYTSAPIEYAYFLDEENYKVVKIVVNNLSAKQK